MKKLLLLGLLAYASVAAQSNSPARVSPTTQNIVELSISGSAVDEEGTEPVELYLKLAKNGNSRAREIYLADPTVYTENGKFYMAGTRSYGPQGFTLLESSDLKH